MSREPLPNPDSLSTSNGLTGSERLILDAMLGDQSPLAGADRMERLWVSAPVLEYPLPVEPNVPGSRGQPSMDRMVAPHRWHLPEED
jgi:glucose-6-phosphate 1-dehydrogenase